MADLPVQFLETMKQLLGEEYEAFLQGYDRRRGFGLRVNTLKMTLEEFERIAPFHLKKIPWIPNGYFYEEGDAPARHPFYAAGLYYLQEPSAMTPASRLPIVPGDKVLDLCAAPGGKATALGAALRGQGLLVANDINTARARALLRNIELFGIPNAFVTNEPPYILAERFPRYFDKIMVDAPCSGEGMFRKNPAVAEAWMEKGPEYFSQLQREIIVHGADMLRPGGLMFYSTCTFSPAENERTITHLLRERPEMEVIPMEDYEGFSEGLTSFDGEDFHESCRLCRRIWPHKMAGEGHFMALLHKKEEGVLSNIWKEEALAQDEMETVSLGGGDSNPSNLSKIYRMQERDTQKKKLCCKEGKGQQKIENDCPKESWWDSCSGLNQEQRQALAEFFVHVRWDIHAEQVEIHGDKVYYVPEDMFYDVDGIDERIGEDAQNNYSQNGRREKKKNRYPKRESTKRNRPRKKDRIAIESQTGKMHFLRKGVYLGDLKKKRFEPSQPFALALSRDSFDACIDFREDDERLIRYLRGESLNLEDMSINGNGWELILADGYPLGFGKLSGITLKNKYPTGWRQNI